MGRGVAASDIVESESVEGDERRGRGGRRSIEGVTLGGRGEAVEDRRDLRVRRGGVPLVQTIAGLGGLVGGLLALFSSRLISG